jgi:hypothetical protein
MSKTMRVSSLIITFALLIGEPLLVAQAGQVTPPVPGGLITLYSRDSVGHTLCFADGQYGLAVHDRQVKNRCSDLDFDNHNPLNFTSGVEGARKAAVIDLGTEDDLRTKYQYQQTYGAVHGFSSIVLTNQKLYIRKGDGRAQQEMSDVEPLFGKLGTLAKSPVRTGHIYLLHIGDGHDSTVNIWVKLLVVSYVQGDSVTIRWERL